MSGTTDSVALLKAAQEGNFTTLDELRKDHERLTWALSKAGFEWIYDCMEHGIEITRKSIDWQMEAKQ